MRAGEDLDVKYPNSAGLFQFCRRVLDHKFGGVRVIDQDVGQVLGFDPADCSHWKKGKKNIRSIQAMKSIADHLGVDERLVVDIAAGEIDSNDAFFEFAGYGAFSIDPKMIDAAKKEFYRRNASAWTKEKEIEFKGYFEINEAKIDAMVDEIHTKIKFQEAPLYLPEVVNAYPNLKLLAFEAATGSTATSAVEPITVTKDGQETTIRYQAGTEMRPFVRYRMARAIAESFLGASATTPNSELGQYTDHVTEVQANMFAGKLLAPARLIRKEMSQLNPSKDIVAQLSELFWVSKTFMNRRIKEILTSAGQ